MTSSAKSRLGCDSWALSPSGRCSAGAAAANHLGSAGVDAGHHRLARPAEPLVPSMLQLDVDVFMLQCCGARPGCPGASGVYQLVRFRLLYKINHDFRTDKKSVHFSSTWELGFFLGAACTLPGRINHKVVFLIIHHQLIMNRDPLHSAVEAFIIQSSPAPSHDSVHNQGCSPPPPEKKKVKARKVDLHGWRTTRTDDCTAAAQQQHAGARRP